jgi:hypothetical protein
LGDISEIGVDYKEISIGDLLDAVLDPDPKRSKRKLKGTLAGAIESFGSTD